MFRAKLRRPWIRVRGRCMGRVREVFVFDSNRENRDSRCRGRGRVGVGSGSGISVGVGVERRSKPSSEGPRSGYAAASSCDMSSPSVSIRVRVGARVGARVTANGNI